MERGTLETAGRSPFATPSVGKRNWAMPLVSGFVVLALALRGVWWFAVRDSGDPAEDLYGEWLTGGGVTMSYGADDSWGGSHPTYGSSAFDWGTYTFDGEVLTYFTDPGGA